MLIHQTGYSTPQSVQTAETANENHHPQKPTKANTITDSAPSVAEKESWHENSDIYRNAGSNGTGSYDYDYDDEDSGLNGHNETSEYDGSLEDRESSGVLEGQRVMSLRRLPLTVTHRDVIDVVRGGALLDISPFRRTLDHNMCTVRITFVEEMAAQKFFNYAKRNGIYVAGRRVSHCYPYAKNYSCLTKLMYRWKLSGTSHSTCGLLNVAGFIMEPPGIS